MISTINANVKLNMCDVDKVDIPDALTQALLVYSKSGSTQYKKLIQHIASIEALNHVKKITSDGSDIEPRSGICAFFINAMTSIAGPANLFYADLAISDFLTDLFRKWPKFSGRRAFPIHYDIELDYNDLSIVEDMDWLRRQRYMSSFVAVKPNDATEDGNFSEQAVKRFLQSERSYTLLYESLWEGEYGALRRELLDFSIEQAKAEAREFFSTIKTNKSFVLVGGYKLVDQYDFLK
ncbi:hypothetical protein KNT64_gp188 [Pseudomonas phage PspYZU05]|uniref:Uncharacterized protein n=1 Tax=Pseudomonas phage PspYZU05 TaxID=1983556 RepID=A0A2U7N2L5_9CAUD|nr:hypothetical protein KNT64_gp188 [Pseudomonas phage PspYZU05]ASD52140.1 hypothetical protein PspYZU05_188 [Pseudomonas phage PspYZU05]